MRRGSVKNAEPVRRRQRADGTQTAQLAPAGYDRTPKQAV